MKTIVFLMFILCAAMCVGQQAGAISSQVQVVQVPEHPQHAEQHALASEHSLLGGGPETYTWAQGERPLWEFGPVSEKPSLGDVARAYRKEKLTARKAQLVLEKQGS